MDTSNKILNGLVTLSFDDGWKCVYKNALPILDKTGLKSTFYIISGCLDDAQFPQYMNISDVLDLQEKGHEIGCHTVSHKHLTQESPEIIENEIFLSFKHLRGLGLSVETFAYPYGEYNESIISEVKRAGFLGARSIITGYNDRATDKFLLQCQAVKVDTTFLQIKEWIDFASSNNKWLILMFHQIDHEGRQWSSTPEMLTDIVKYLNERKIKVVTIKDVLKNIQSL